ncbi:MAG TPA: ACT domain-containing protein [Tepidisphaeraceae bacterium]
MTHAILTAVGSDRPGLVDEVSEFIFQQGGNIEDSRMVNLRGQFAMMVLLSGTEETLGKIRAGLPGLSAATNLHAELRPAESARTAASAQALPYRLTATAMDQAGLVHHIAHLLKTMSVNIESLETRLAAAPITGAPVFEMELILSVPRSTAISKLRQSLGGLCDELNIDWELDAM